MHTILVRVGCSNCNAHFKISSLPTSFATETSRTTTRKKMTVLLEDAGCLSASLPRVSAVASPQQTIAQAMAQAMAPPAQAAPPTAMRKESEKDDQRVAFESEPEPNPQTSDDIVETIGKSAAMAIELLDSEDRTRKRTPTSTSNW